MNTIPNRRVNTTKLLEGRSPPIVFHLSVTDHILCGETKTKHAPIKQRTIPAMTSSIVVMICDAAKLRFFAETAKFLGYSAR